MNSWWRLIKRFLQSVTILEAIVLTTIATLIAANFIMKNPAQNYLGETDEQILSACVDRVALSLEKKLEQQDKMNYAAKYCYDLSYTSLHLEDFRIRKKKLVDQAKSEPIILWMVVVITMSGVLMAAYQVHASFMLAERLGKIDANLGGEITSSKDTGFVIRSSVTGLLILVVSFAFFLIYIRFVYRIEYLQVYQGDGAPTQRMGITKEVLEKSESLSMDENKKVVETTIPKPEGVDQK